MKDYEKNIPKHNSLSHFYATENCWKEKRLVFEAPAPAPAPEAPAGEENPPKVEQVVDLRKLDKTAEFKDNRMETLKMLALNNTALAENFEQAIKESLQKAGYDNDIKKFWQELKTNGCNKVEVKNSRIRFLKDNIEVTPRFSVIPIQPDLSKFHTDMPTTQYYNAETGNVSLQGYKETTSIRIGDLVLNARSGTKVEITRKGQEKSRTAEFKDDKEAYFTDGQKEKVKIWNGDTVKLIREPVSPPATVEGQETWGKYPSAGEFKYVEKSEGKEGYSADDYIKWALTGTPVIEGNPSNANLQRIRKMAKEGYTEEQYEKFLQDKGAIKEDRIALLVDTDYVKVKQQQQQKKEETEKAIKRRKGRESTKEEVRMKYLLPRNISNSIKFKLKDPKMVEAIDDPKRWADAWAAENLEGIKILKGIIQSEPIFGQYRKNPDALRERVRDAISRGLDGQLDFEDFIDHILQGTRMPSFAPEADSKYVTDMMKGKQKFMDLYRFVWKTHKTETPDEFKKAYGLLRKLGPDTLNTAVVRGAKEDELWLDIKFEGHAYTVKINEGGAVTGEETIKFFVFNSNYRIPNNFGYEEGLRYTVNTLNTGDFGTNNDVRTEVRNALTPPMTHARFTALYSKYFDQKGNPKDPNMPAHFTKAIQNTIIGGNRFLLQLSELRFTEATKGESARYSFFENRTAKLPNEKFEDIINDKEAWFKEWNNPTMPVTKRLKSVFAEDHVLREISPQTIAPRLHKAVNNGDESQLDMEDVFEEVLRGILLPPRVGERSVMIDDYDDFVERYQQDIDAQGNPKPGVPEHVSIRYKNILKAANKVLAAFEGRIENIREKSEDTYYSQKLRQARLIDFQYDTPSVYNLDDIMNLAKTPELYFLQPTNKLPSRAGIDINNFVLGRNKTMEVLQYKMYLFQSLLKTYSLDQLIARGCISKGNSKVLPNQEFYLIHALPPEFAQYINQNGLANLARSGLDFGHPGWKERLNPQARLERYSNFFFPIKEHEKTYTDVSEAKGTGREDERIYNRMDFKFAHSQFLEDITENGNINEQKLYFQLNRYLQLFDARLELEFPQDAPKIRAKFEKAIGKQLRIGSNNIEALINNPNTREELAKAIRIGFLCAHDEKIDKQREEAISTLRQNFQEWKKTLGKEDLQELEKALQKSGMPPEEIPAAIEKILPIWFAIGIDTVTGNIGLGVGAGIPIKLGHDGEYGTIILGAGVGVGANYKTGAVGAHVGVGIGYKSPKLGPFSLILGGGVHAGVSVGPEGTEFGAGFGVGAGIEIELGTISDQKISMTPGVTYPFLVGFILSIEPDHEVSIQDAQQAAREGCGFDKVDTELLAAKSPQERVEAIAKNTYARYAIERANRSPINQMTPEKVIREYKKMKANLDQTVRENYDPGNRWSFGLGVDPKSGKFIFGIGTSIITSKEVKSVAYEGKGSETMEQEVTLQQLKALADKRNRGVVLTGTEQSQIESLTRSGKLLTVAGSKDLAVYMPKENLAPKTLSQTAQEGPIDSIDKLERGFNEILKPLNLYVEYDQTTKLFELKFLNWNQNTNYDFAVDSKMENGGIIYNKGRIYLASSFDINTPPTILRSDYEYPFAKNGKNYHSIVTISDSPLTPAHEIYNSSTHILSSKGGDWFPQQGEGYDRTSGIRRNPRILSLTEGSSYSFDANRFKTRPSETPARFDEPAITNYIDTLSVTETEKGTVNQTKIESFAKRFITRYPISYRKLSNKETIANDFGKLNELLVKEWVKAYTSKPYPAELNAVRLQLMHESFVELGTIKSPKARQAAFEQRMEGTVNFIIKPRFKLLKERNNVKYKADDPRYIRNDSDAIMRVILARIKTINVNSDQGSKLMSEIDRSSSVAGTMKILGFRGDAYGADGQIDPQQKMIGASLDYSDLLKSQPDGIYSDIARLIFEETSTLPQELEINPESPIDSLDPKKVSELLRADISQKIISNLFSPLSAKLFSEGVRGEILRLAAENKSMSLVFTQLSVKAIYEFQKLVTDIRKAELSGEKYYIPLTNPDFRFVLNYEVQDGVYVKCTNYSMWVNESFDLQMRSSKIPSAPFALNAGYGKSTGTTALSSTLEFTSINAAAAVAAKPPAPGTTVGGEPQSAGPQGETKTGSGDRESGQQTTPDRGTPTTDVPNAPPPTDVDNAGSEGF